MARTKNEMLFVSPVASLDIDGAKNCAGYLDLAVSIPSVTISTINPPLESERYINMSSTSTIKPSLLIA